ncbi:ABC transporter permease [Halomonas sp. GFAJ-1]|nr:metal ABC transporter permease [Halomonas sp. GFAJ-1]AVI63490.1 hypothetical protein BB497_12660 [Halomonas sp. GFAJ-1]EHK62665.1 ABC transporter permease [Halomonas sp. GFAJ-1]
MEHFDLCWRRLDRLADGHQRLVAEWQRLCHGHLARRDGSLRLVAVTFVAGVRIDLHAYLFGDILAVGKTDLVIIWFGAILVIGLMLWR